MKPPVGTFAGSGSRRHHDPYVAYIHRFFHRWLPVYDWFARSIFWVYRAAVRQVDPKAGMRVLDICTGTGEVALRCAWLGADVTAVDVTPEMLDKAKCKAARQAETRGVTFDEADARRLAFPDSSFDVAILAFALHDMPRSVRLQVLKEAARVARLRLVILDYDLPRTALWRRIWISLISLFETAYFKNFAAEGTLPLLKDAGVLSLPGRSTASPRVRRLSPPLFSILEVEL